MDATQERREEVHGPIQGPLLVRDEETLVEGPQRTCEGERSHRRPSAEGVERSPGLNSHMRVNYIRKHSNPVMEKGWGVCLPFGPSL